MTPQPLFQPGDRARCTDNVGTNGLLTVGQVYYVFGITKSEPQQLLINAGLPALIFLANRFDQMRPTTLAK